MSFILKKKRFKFQVDLMLADLSNVPFVNAVLFAKVRLLDGGNFCEMSQRVEVFKHHVVWGKTFRFTCRIASNPQNGMLEPCLCRLSVRKELKGGKSYAKLGFVDVNLSEYAGSGIDGVNRTYLLEGYNSGRQRQDNSLLRINVGMVLLSADPCFKVPSTSYSAMQQSALHPSERRAPGDDGLSVNSISSGFESLGRRTKLQSQTIVPVPQEEQPARIDFAPGHSRNSSQTSHHSHGSGYGSGQLTHSRQSSSESGRVRRNSTDLATTNASVNKLNVVPAIKKRAPSNNDLASSSQSRIDSTRVDNGVLIAELMKNHDLQIDGSDNSSDISGLQLYVSKEDGSVAVMGSRDMRRMKPGVFEQVIIDGSDQIKS